MKKPPTSSEARGKALTEAVEKAGMRTDTCGGEETVTLFGHHLHLRISHAPAGRLWVAHPHGAPQTPVAAAPLGEENGFAAELSQALKEQAEKGRRPLVRAVPVDRLGTRPPPAVAEPPLERRAATHG